MDLRENFIKDILMKMTGLLDNEQMDKLEETLCLELNNYEIQKRCTEIIEIDERPIALLNRFLATKRLEGRSENTVKQYHLHLYKLITTLSKDLNKVTTYDLRYYLSDYKHKRGVSNLSLDNMRRCISSFFSWLHNEGFITRNPTSALKRISYEKVVKKPYSQEEVERLKWACTNLRDLALVEFFYASGCRVSEVSNIDITDIDFSNRTVVVTGKGNKQRKVYITETCCLHLKNYLNERKDHNPALFVSNNAPHFRLQKNGIEASLRRLGSSTGITKVHPHRYRRTFATNMIDRGAHIQDVQKILGHEDIRTTEIYCFVSDTNIRHTYDKYAC